MNSRKLWLTIPLVAMLALPAVAMMMTETITGEYHPSSKTLQFDQALKELGNSPGGVYGTSMFFSEVGVTESLYFAGDTKAFQAFLDKYAKLNYPPLTLQIRKEDAGKRPVLRVEKPGSGCDGKPVEYDEIHYDWMLSHHLPGTLKGDKEFVYLELWPGKVQWDRVRVPKNVTVKK